jgi:single-strand DNA-binding protein
MARGLNSIFLVGTLTQKPELRYTPAGLAILEVNLAGSDQVISEEDQQVRELAWYHRATVFGAQAENLSNQLQEPGVPLLVEGRLNYRSWDTPEGQRRNSIDITASRIDLLTFGVRGEDATLVDARDQHRLRNALNEVMIIGNLTRDAELRYTPSGHAVTRFSVAVNERFRDRSGADQERTHFIDVTVWRDLAVGCGDLGKGDPVFVVGRLVNDSWTDKEGNRRYTTRIEGSRVEFLTRGPGGGGAGTRAEQPAQRDQSSRLDIDEEFPPEEDLPF